MPRKANEKDAAAIFALMQECVSPPWTEEQTKAALSSELTDAYVCEEDGKIVAYIIIENVLDEGCVASVAVRADKQRKGLGKTLLEYVLGESKAASVYLEVAETNVPAIALYVSCGFKPAGKRKKYYGDVGAAIMRKELNDKDQQS